MFKKFFAWALSTNKTHLVVLLIALLLVGVEVYLLKTSPDLPPQVPLWYSKTWGEEQLSSPEWLWLIPTANFGFVVLNYSLSLLVKKREATVASILVWSMVPITLAGTVTLYRILMVVSP
jgi:hypothetical protein